MAWASPFTLGQRWEFLLSGSYYFIGFCWMVLFVLPIVYIFFQIPVYVANPLAYLGGYVPYFFLSFTFFLQTLVARRYRIRDWLLAESLALIAVPVFLRAGIDALLHRSAHFDKTRKDVRIYEMPYDVLGVQIMMALFSMAAVYVGVRWIWYNGFDLPMVVNVFWCFFHLCILLYLPFVLYAKKHRSRYARALYS